MSYPRLAFANRIPQKIMDAELIEDLKLDLVLAPEVTDFLLYAPEKDTLLMRQEAFRLLLADPESEDRLSALCDSLASAEELYRALTSSLSEKTAAFIFVRLFEKVSEFCALAKEMRGYGQLFSRFSEAINELFVNEKFIKASSVIEMLEEKLSTVTGVRLKTDAESIISQKGDGEGIAASLRACAKELGIEINDKPITPITLQKGIADSLGAIYPEACGEAVKFLSDYRTLITGEIFDYTPELKFFKNAVSFIKKAANHGLPYCLPELSNEKIVDFKNVYDITLLKKSGEIIPNDVRFTVDEPFFYLTGANGGGKTTYIRAVGGAALFFLAGMPIFATGGQASLLSAVYAHFPRDERFEGTGRFLDEKNRVDVILKKQDGNALILLNETFSTTGEEKAIEQTGILADTLYGSGSFGLYITHQHDVSKTEIPFLGVTVDELNSNRRTYKIEKRRLPPRSFAKDILEKYGLDAKSLQNKFKG